MLLFIQCHSSIWRIRDRPTAVGLLLFTARISNCACNLECQNKLSETSGEFCVEGIACFALSEATDSASGHWFLQRPLYTSFWFTNSANKCLRKVLSIFSTQASRASSCADVEVYASALGERHWHTYAVVCGYSRATTATKFHTF